MSNSDILIFARLLKNRARTWRRKAQAVAPDRYADELHIEARALEQLADLLTARAAFRACPGLRGDKWQE